MLVAQNNVPITVMLVNDQELVRSGLARLIADQEDMQVVAGASSGEEALHMAEEFRPNVILMEVKMDGMGGMAATQRIVQQWPEARIIAMSALDVGLIPTRMFRAGAVGFISNCVTVQEMLRALRLVHAGERYISPRIAMRLALNPFHEKGKSPFDELSERELQVALMLIDCHKVNHISDQLSLSPKTVYSYRYRIFEKLGLSSNVELTILAAKHGLSDVNTSSNPYK